MFKLYLNQNTFWIWKVILWIFLIVWTLEKNKYYGVARIEWDVGIFLDNFMIGNWNEKSRTIVVAVDCTYIFIK